MRIGTKSVLFGAHCFLLHPWFVAWGWMDLYRANVERSIHSKAGQARLRELREALLALPAKALEADIFAEGTREQPRVCALGAWALHKHGGDVDAAHAMVPRDGDDCETQQALKAHGWPKLVVFEAIYMNDEGSYRVQTPAQRYDYIMRWLDENLKAPL